MSVDTADRAEVVLRLIGVELVERQIVFALGDFEPRALRRHSDGPAHTAYRACAAADRGQAFREFNFKLNRAAMT